MQIITAGRSGPNRDLRFGGDLSLDDAGRRKPQLVRLLGGYILRNRAIHLLVQVDEIEVVDERSAQVRLYAAVAARPFADLDELFALRAGLYRFDLELRLTEDTWRLHSARWQRATREDFLRS